MLWPMPARELVVLGTASQAPTRHRNHNGYLLRWDTEGVLFDPGEGTQRQLLLAGVASATPARSRSRWSPPVSTTAPRRSAGGWRSPTAAGCGPTGWPPPASPAPTWAGCNGTAHW